MSVTAARGFLAGGIACGIKPSGRPDLALVATADRRVVPAAGVFTTNLATAAPVQVSKEHLVDGRAAGVVLSSGNANAATGEQGRRDARRMCALAAEGLGVDEDDLLVCSTGLIGIPLTMAPIESGMPSLAAALAPGAAAGVAAAEAIMTTDTLRKESVTTFEHLSVTQTVGGMAKGAAMLAPAMATMLAVITTDTDIDAPALQAALTSAVSATFDNLVVDACRSTNDTVLVLANGASGGRPITASSGLPFAAFVSALTSVCGSLAEQMARDAEGATKLARVTVLGARSTADARAAARGVAGSQLVQCSLYGEDPYWGRVISELGASGAFLDPERIDISYNDVVVCRDGVACDHDREAVAAAMAGREIDIHCDLHMGHGEATVLFTDLTHAYIDENKGTS